MEVHAYQWQQTLLKITEAEREISNFQVSRTIWTLYIPMSRVRFSTEVFIWQIPTQLCNKQEAIHFHGGNSITAWTLPESQMGKGLINLPFHIAFYAQVLIHRKLGKSIYGRELGMQSAWQSAAHGLTTKGQLRIRRGGQNLLYYYCANPKGTGSGELTVQTTGYLSCIAEKNSS